MSLRERAGLRWGAFERSSDAYGVVVVMLFLMILIPPFLAAHELWEAIATVVLAGGVVVLTLKASQISTWIVVVAAGVSLAAVIAVVLTDPPQLLVNTTGILLAVLLVASPLAILSRIARHRQVTLRTVFGAVAVYLQWGVAFALFYGIVHDLAPAAFPAVVDPSFSEWVYFSFITLATVGYGDITPATDIARTMTIFEALTGQIFLVVIVARVVGMLGQETTRARDIDIER